MITITDTNATGDANTFKAYQIFKGDVVVDGTSKILSNVKLGDDVKSEADLVNALKGNSTLSAKDFKNLASDADAATIAKAIADAGISSDTTSEGKTAYSSDAQTLAQALKSVLKTGDSVGKTFTYDSSTKKYTLTGLTPGYYLVTSANGERLILGVTDVTANEKNEYPTVGKKQKKDGAEGDYTDDAISQEIGKVVDYQVTINIPATANKAITVTDIISQGMTMNTSVTGTIAPASFSSETAFTGWAKDSSDTTKTNVYTANWGTGTKCDASGTAIESGEYTKYTLTIPAELVFSIAQTASDGQRSIVLTYTATVNENAVSNQADSDKASIDYENYHHDDTEVKVTTYGFKVLKYDGSIINDSKTVDSLTDTDVLPGAAFELYRDAGCKDRVSLIAENGSDYQYRVAKNDKTGVTSFTTVKDHQTEIRGLDDGVTYYPKETKAPDGYNMISPNPVQVNNSGKNNDENVLTDNVVTKIANNKGSVLPSTGGIGTTIFYIAGGILIVAAVLLIARRKKSNA